MRQRWERDQMGMLQEVVEVHSRNAVFVAGRKDNAHP